MGVWANVVIGLWSIGLVALLGGPRSANRHLVRDVRRLDRLPLVAGTLPALRLNPRALINTRVREGNSPTHAAVRHRCC